MKREAAPKTETEQMGSDRQKERNNYFFEEEEEEEQDGRLPALPVMILLREVPFAFAMIKSDTCGAGAVLGTVWIEKRKQTISEE